MADGGREELFSVRMRAGRGEGADAAHVSGAERIAPAGAVPDLARALALRALRHRKGAPDAIHITVEALAEPCMRLRALPARAVDCADPDEGMRLAIRLLEAAGVSRAADVPALLAGAAGMRGAILADADTLERLEPDRSRGVRATRMDAAWTGGMPDGPDKNHYREAIVLATKAAHAPGMVAELCVSDDPDYVTGYVASKTLGYVRLRTLKRMGDPCGGRVFLIRGDDPAAVLRFLERVPVLVEDIPPPPAFVAPGEILP